MLAVNVLLLIITLPVAPILARPPPKASSVRVLVYMVVAFAQYHAIFDHDIGQRKAAAAAYCDVVNIDARAVKDASTSARGILCRGISARAACTVVGRLAVLNRQILKDNESHLMPVI